jgi:hypothetical protein
MAAKMSKDSRTNVGQARRLVAVAAVVSLCAAGGLVAWAMAAGPPSATTGAVTDVTTTSGTVTGTVNPNGESTTYSFQFGTTTGYGSQTSPQSAGAGTAEESVSGAITGLAAGTTYHYRLIATNASATTVGADMTFTTSGTTPPPPKSPPPTATTGAADRVGRHGATVHGTVNPRDTRTTYYFEFGLTSAYGVRSTPRSLAAGNRGRSISAAFTGLQSGRTYHYRLVARNTNGVGLGQDKVFTTSRSSAGRSLPGMTVFVKPLRDRRKPFWFKVSGKVIRPSGLSRSRACRGGVTIRFKARGKAVRTGRVRLTRKCKYRARVNVPVRRHPRSLRVLVRFRGNAVLKPRSVPAVRVRAG